MPADEIEVVCHMIASLDGKCDGEAFKSKNFDYFLKSYYDVDAKHFADTPVTFSGRKCLYDVIELEEKLEDVPEGTISRDEDFIKPFEDTLTPGRHWHCVVDPRGKMTYKTNVVDSKVFPFYNGDRVVEIVTKKGVSDAFLSHLRKIGVPYIFAGEEELSCSLAVRKACEYLGVKKVILHGGPTLNYSFLKENLITTPSLIQIPTISSHSGDLPLFNPMNGEQVPRVDLTLIASESLEHGGAWLRYSIDANSH
ncbi:hypothetical protein ADEAN_000513200 [Angomonas deanei]|uniref:RibD C-terminal domain containing protein n=1 Tax=Angomonas deanei TaxID=59799 RepID=A0A7G2CG21_9TRYP|nr:hypothetical protein ADEAN_000513200 [Angomonas deanei]